MTGRTATRRFQLASAAIAVLALAGCSASQAASRTVDLTTLNNSGVSGTAVLTDLGDGTSEVVVDVEPAGHPDMPAHIHPGTCAELVPQPRFPLANVVDGMSTSIVPATLEELFAGGLAVNLHASPNDYETFTACADLTD